MNAFFCICATKINLVFLLIFAGAGMGFTLLGSALWALAEGALVAGDKLLVVSLSVIHFIRFVFLTCLGLWFGVVLHCHAGMVFAADSTPRYHGLYGQPSCW